MTRYALRTLLFAAATFTSIMALHQTTQAGPPLLCRPFEIDGARSLPWDGPHWRSVKADYQINRLVDDTLALLTPETPVIVRMETLRRAAIYAVWSLNDREVGYVARDLSTANELLSRLRERARQENGRHQALALFDIGYLTETFKQAAPVMQERHQLRALQRDLKLDGDIDGYASVIKAIERRRGDAVMEFAAAIIAQHPRRADLRAHLQKAVAGAPDGSLLARNLVIHFNDRGKSVAELRAQLGLAKN